MTEEQQTPANPARVQQETSNAEVQSEPQEELQENASERDETKVDDRPVEAVESASDAPVATEQSELEREYEEVVTALQDEIANINRKLQEQTQLAEGFKAQYARNAADFENFRRRTLKEQEEQKTQIKRQVVNDILPVVDNFERARAQIKPATDGEKTIHNSYQGVYKTFVDALKRLGVSAMRPEGEQFDPMYHEAMLREATNEHPEGTVLEQLMRGYLIDDKVLRHAMVKVAVPTEETDNSKETIVEAEVEENLSE
jgi:molecular chaperone GrpE